MITEEDIKFEWECWGNTKPWYCPKCKWLLASDKYEFCDGTDVDFSEDICTPHEKIQASLPVTYEEFSKIQFIWDNEENSKGSIENDK